MTPADFVEVDLPGSMTPADFVAGDQQFSP
jgi:hypothetical protein